MTRLVAMPEYEIGKIVFGSAASVDAAGRQIAAIEKLKAEDKYDTLPQALKETAEMRLLYPSLPLSELANKFAPPLTKSGLNNRLKKILELAN